MKLLGKKGGVYLFLVFGKDTFLFLCGWICEAMVCSESIGGHVDLERGGLRESHLSSSFLFELSAAVQK